LIENKTIELEVTNERLIKSLRDQQIQIERRIEFTRALVHELKTPLTAMIGSSEMLAEQPMNELGNKLAMNINRGSRNLRKRIDELLDLTRAEMGTLQISCSIVDPLTVVREVTEDMFPEAMKKGQSIVTNFPISISPIYVDDDRLRQILFNLIGNAIKYNLSEGIIKLTVTQNDKLTSFEIRDEGIGMSPEEQSGLFNLYYRGEKNNERLGGLGIGLALSKTLVELHGGKIWVTSQKGRGSTFTFTIPLNNNVVRSEE
jgi:signal transduction histidine kinase